MKTTQYHRQTLTNQVVIVYKYVAGGTKVVAVAYAPSSTPTDQDLKLIPRREWRSFDTSTMCFI